MIGSEVLDDPAAEPALVRAALRDLGRLNRIAGGTRAVIAALRPFWRRARGETWTLLDVGTGLGDIPRAAAATARRDGVTLRLIGLERLPAAARAARAAGLADVVLGDGGALPFRPKSVDVAIASQVLHHVPPAEAVRWIAALDALARRVVVVADLRRSLVAMLLLWLASFPLGLHAVTRHDGVVSLRRGFTAAELDALLDRAGIVAVTRARPIARLVAAWEPRGR